MPEPLYRLEPRLAECSKLHALSEYGLMNVKLYEDIVRHGSIATTYDYPVIVNDRYLAAPSPIPKFDNPKMHMNPALQLFGAGRERRIYAIPPYTSVRSLDFEDYPFEVQRWEHACEICGSRESFLDEMIVDDKGKRMFICSDSDYCQQQVAKRETDSAPVAEPEGARS
jgi:alpha-D-ribose 1-methylphosphonate 5-phosphate C-P lyase